MVSNGAEDVQICGSGEAECPETTVEIKIKMLDSQTYTLRVDKCVPVPALKEQIATVTGVLTEQQRLICRGKVLKDDQLLSAYHVEDGHTLHLVVRQPSSDSTPDPQATASASSAGYSQGNRVSPGVVVGTYSSSDHGDGIFPDLNRIVTAVLGSFGIASAGGGNEGIDLHGFGPASLGNIRDSGRSQTEQAHTRDQSSVTTSASTRPTDVPPEALQAPVIPDSLTTLTQYLSHLTAEFRANVRGQSETTQSAGGVHVADRTALEATTHSIGERGFPTPASLAEVIILTRQLFMEQVVECLSQFSTLLENQASVTNPGERMRIQSYALRTGGLFRNIGAMLLELGRTTMTLRMGETPDDAVVNAGPAVFVSTAGPNPIMVQPLPFQPNASFGAVPVGTVQNNTGFSGGSVSSGFIPRNIDIRIRTGSFMASNPNRREPAGGSQQPGQAGQAASIGGSSDQQNTGGTRSSSARESAVRVVPIRTVVTAVPASIGRSTSDSVRNPMGIFYPVLARVQHVSSGNSNNSGASQESDQNNLHGVETRNPANPDSAGQQQNAGLPSVEGNFSSFSEASNGEEFSAQYQSSVDQLLRSLFSGESVHHENVNDRGVSMNSTSGDGVEAENNSNSQETEAAGDEGVFLSNILRHIMPIISETNGTSSANLPSERSNMAEDRSDGRQTQAQENTENASSSHQRRDPPLPPSSKRQKGE